MNCGVKYTKVFVDGPLEGLQFDDFLSAPDQNHAVAYYNQYLLAEKNGMVYRSSSSYIVKNIELVKGV